MMPRGSTTYVTRWTMGRSAKKTVVGVRDGPVAVGDHGKLHAQALGESALRGDRVGRDADDLGAERAQVVVVVAEPFGLDRARPARRP
jgi:hypothetical protein